MQTPKPIRNTAIAAFLLNNLVSTSSGAISFTDLAIIGVRSSNIDGYAVVALNDWQTGDSFFIGDIGVDGDTIASVEDLYQVTVTSTVTAGTVIVLDERTTDNFLSSPMQDLGITTSRSQDGGPYGRDQSIAAVAVADSDAVIAFTSTDNAMTPQNSTNLFYVASTDGTLIDENDTGTPRGLGETSGRVNRTGEDYFYTGTLEGTQAELFAAISDDANWTRTVDPAPDFLNSVLPNNWGGTDGFNVLAIPEPSSALLTLMGLAFCARRKRA